MKKCVICDSGDNAFVLLNDQWEYSGIQIAVNRQGMLRCRSFEEGKDVIDFLSQDIINIQYCPICGKKFKAEEPSRYVQLTIDGDVEQ